MHLSLIIPAYNEAQRIPQTLEQAIAYLRDAPYRAEILVVDDGSTDTTADCVRAYLTQQPVPVQLIELGRNQGKGAAVRAGMTAASGEYRLFSDADASTPIDEVEKLWPCFEQGADIVIGSRALPESDIQVHQPWYREAMGRVFNVIEHVLRLTPFKDTQCGFKCFTAAACGVVFPRQRVEHFSFDAELLHIAGKHGLRIREVPVRWINSPQSRVNPVTDASRMFLDLLRIRWNDLRGRYG